MSLFEQTAKINGPLGAAVAVLGACAWAQPALRGTPLWRHLAAGRQVWQQGPAPAQDPFSYTAAAGVSWVNPSWLWDALAWGAWSLHPQALAWLQLLGIALWLALLLWLARRAGASLLGAGAALWLLAASTHAFMGIGPELSTLLLLTVLLLLHGDERAPFAWPPLVLLWANLDEGAVFGVIALALQVGTSCVRASRSSGRLSVPRRPAAGLLLAALALLLTPWGLASVGQALGGLADSGFHDALLWSPPAWSLDPRSYGGRFAWLALLAGAGSLRLWRKRPDLVVLALLAFALACGARRFIPLFAVAALAPAAVALSALERRLRQRWPLLGQARTGAAALACAALAAGWLWSDLRLAPALLERWTGEDRYPAAAVRYLRELGPRLRILNQYDWGGYLMLQLPESRVFIDDRDDAVYDDHLLNDYHAIAKGAPGARARLERYRIEAALIGNDERFPDFLAREGGWKLIYADTVARVLVPPDSPLLQRALPSPERVVGGQPSFRALQARRASARGAVREAARLLEGLLQDDPLFLSGYGQLALLHADRGDPSGIEDAIALGRAAYPRRSRDLFEMEGRAWEQAGYLARALHAYRRTLPAGPMRPDTGRRARVRSVEEKLAPTPEAGGP